MSAVSLALEALATNPAEVRDKCVEIVRTLLNNIVEKPTEAKYRSVRVANPRFAQPLLGALIARRSCAIAIPEPLTHRNLRACR